MSVLVVGEALVEFMRSRRDVPLDRSAEIVGPFPSGAPAIFADYLARLGSPVALCAVVGDDPFGSMLVERLGRDGVDVGHVRVDPDRTTATAFVSYSSEGSRTFVFHVRHAAAAQLTAADLGDLPERSDWIHVSGSTVALVPSMAEVVAGAVRRVQAAGGKLSVDPNVRPEAASPAAIEQVRELVGVADFVFPSLGELAVLGVDEEELAERGAVVCTTLGAAGARVRVGDEVTPVAAPAAREVDPTGAGDAFAAGFTAATILGADPGTAARIACEIAARSVAVLGPMEAEVEPLTIRPSG